jgi:hypothetical protein
MIEAIRLIWKCGACDDVVVSYSNIGYDMNYCQCGGSAVDLEEHYQRNMGEVVEIRRHISINGEWISNDGKHLEK